MGITKLADLIRSDAPDAISRKEISDYTGKVIALDTFIIVNQFRAATPRLSPLLGLFFRTLTLLEHDIKPVFVFDGKPPVEKTAVLEKRAETAGWSFPNHTGAASSQTKNCLQLLKLLGVPVIQAPGDAEALCAQLVREGTVDAVASEDMDTLPFGANILIRNVNAKKDSEVVEYSLPKLLEKLQISHQETHPVPHFWKYNEARKIFLGAPQSVTIELAWTEPDEEAIVKFLCDVKHVKENRVRHRMQTFRQVRESKREEREKEKATGCSRQTRIKDFFRVTRKRAMHVETSDLSSDRKKPKLQ
ncbi:probable flap endonuclease 1 homolog isoform X2 [Antennarius striatus]|uniref:probable flap endonuclease 1 homolog isoform X2 n=1 Tax=Antennarius striatus TaxID=241820 RepID=UPI0035B2AA0D